MSRTAIILCSGLLAGFTSQACASGFALSGKSTSSLGSAFSGTTVAAEDATVVYSNPALMQSLDSDQLSVALHAIIPGVQFDNDGSNTSGADSEHIDSLHFIPNVYYVKALNDDASVGVGIYSPFGLGLEYDKNWIGRYHTTHSKLRTINISPAFSFAASERFNIGIGVDFQYATAELANAVDYSAFGSPDGSLTLTGHNWAIGYSMGLSYDVSDATRLGLTFHSSTHHDFNGDANFDNVPSTLPPPYNAIFRDTGASLTLVLPESINIGVRHSVSPRLDLLADYSWTRWSCYDELAVRFDNGVTSVTEQNWRNVPRYSIGMNYRWTDEWLIRAGASYEITPIPDAEHRTPRIPDANKLTLGLGSRFDLSETLNLDMALTYTLPAKSKINNTDSQGHLLKGDYEFDSSYISVQLNWKL